MRLTGPMLGRIRKLVAYLLAAVVLLAAAGESVPGPAAAQAQQHHAGLVIQFSDGSVRTYCIPFTGDTISGIDLLLKTGLEVKLEAYGGLGGEICKIGSDGCDYPGQPCACQSYGPGGVYWSYHHLQGGKWRSSPVGAGSYKAHDGDVDGWAWSGGTPPSVVPTFAQLCATAQPATPPPPTATRRATATRTRVPTPRPILTSKPRPRPTVTAAPRATATRQIAPPTTASVSAPTITPSLTSTPTATSTPGVTVTPTPTASPSPETTFTPFPASPSPTATVAPPAGKADNPEDRARIVGVILGMIAAVSFIVWRGLVAARGRGGQSR